MHFTEEREKPYQTHFHGGGGGEGQLIFLKKESLVKSIFKKRIDDQFMFIRKIGNSESCRLV